MIRVEHVYDHRSATAVHGSWWTGYGHAALARRTLKSTVVARCTPSTTLRRGSAMTPARWEEFKKRYFKELDEEPAAWQPLLEAAHKGHVVLLEGAHDEEHNQASRSRTTWSRGCEKRHSRPRKANHHAEKIQSRRSRDLELGGRARQRQDHQGAYERCRLQGIHAPCQRG